MISKIRNQVVEEAGNWYLELRESGTKTIAFYKERLDSLLSYQKKLNEILNTCEAPEIRIRAIAELHRIEISLHTIFQELPHEQFQIRPKIQSETLSEQEPGDEIELVPVFLSIDRIRSRTLALANTIIVGDQFYKEIESFPILQEGYHFERKDDNVAYPLYQLSRSARNQKDLTSKSVTPI